MEHCYLEYWAATSVTYNVTQQYEQAETELSTMGHIPISYCQLHWLFWILASGHNFVMQQINIWSIPF